MDGEEQTQQEKDNSQRRGKDRNDFDKADRAQRKEKPLFRTQFRPALLLSGARETRPPATRTQGTLRASPGPSRILPPAVWPPSPADEFLLRRPRSRPVLLYARGPVRNDSAPAGLGGRPRAASVLRHHGTRCSSGRSKCLLEMGSPFEGAALPPSRYRSAVAGAPVTSASLVHCVCTRVCLWGALMGVWRNTFCV